MAKDKQTMPPQRQDRQPGRESEMSPRPDYMPRFRGADRLSGKIAIITGGDSGIGRAVAVLFAREGARLALVYLEEESDARETAELVEAEGGECLTIPADLGERAACREVVARVVERYSGIDVLINNCAEHHPADDIRSIDDDQLDRTVRTNLYSYIYMVQESLPFLSRGASIVNTTSVTAYRGSPHLIDYSATKGAIVSLTRSLAKALADRDIRVNGVAPGPIWTPLIPASFDRDYVASFGGSQLLQRPGQPNEVAPCHLFLASEDSSYMTGQILHPNGGEIVGS